MLLSILVSKVGSIVESPFSRFAVLETTVADRYVAMVVVAHSEIKPISKSGDGGLIEATLDRNGQFRPVFKVVNFSIFRRNGTRSSVHPTEFAIESLSGNGQLDVI